METYKDIPNYEGIYQVSDKGNVKSLKRIQTWSDGRVRNIPECIRKQFANKKGYYTVGLNISGNDKTHYVHQLVARTFLNYNIGNRKRVVDHIDNDRSNNNLSNLQIISQRDNTSKDQKNRSSKYIGVSWHKSSKTWRASIWVNGIKKHLGGFKNEINAHFAYQSNLESLEKIQKIRR